MNLLKTRLTLGLKIKLNFNKVVSVTNHLKLNHLKTSNCKIMMLCHTLPKFQECRIAAVSQMIANLWLQQQWSCPWLVLLKMLEANKSAFFTLTKSVRRKDFWRLLDQQNFISILECMRQKAWNPMSNLINLPTQNTKCIICLTSTNIWLCLVGRTRKLSLIKSSNLMVTLKSSMLTVCKVWLLKMQW
mgnify:CR=1 FL=1